MTEEELKAFIENQENERLEYKLKPNFCEIKETFDHIKNRVHFKILKTIYAFANTEGGELYIGIDDKKQIVSIDSSDKEVIENTILKKVSSKIQKDKERIDLKNGRCVIKLKVQELSVWDKPLFLDGILYTRNRDKTEKVGSLQDYLPLYEEHQFYLFFIKGIESNLTKIIDKRDVFEFNQFIEGLKIKIKSFIEKKQIVGHEKLLKVEQLLDEIKKTIVDEINKKIDSRPSKIPPQPSTSVDTLLKDFIKTYKSILEG